MIRRYVALFAVVALLGVALTVIGRPHAQAPRAAAVAQPATVVDLAIAVENGRVTPEIAAVPKDTRVRLAIVHRGSDTARLSLAGYEDRLAIPPLGPGATWRGEFLADRPGEDFAWLLAGRPAGRFEVTGSHLIEGHR